MLSFHLTPHLLAAVLTGAAMAAQAAGFSDANVSPASYTPVVVHTDPSVGYTVSATAAGHPGSGLQLSYGNAGGPVSMVSMLGFLYQGFSYNPAVQGAVGGVSFSNDRYVDGGDTYLNTTLTTYSRLLLQQGGLTYVAAIFDEGQPRQTWFTTSATGLTAASFGLLDLGTGNVDPAQNPNFSASGAALSFGFMNRLYLDTTGQPYALNATFLYDNIMVDVTPVPEPASWLLMAVALLCAPALRRRAAAH